MWYFDMKENKPKKNNTFKRTAYALKLVWEADKLLLVFSIFKNSIEQIFYVFFFVYLTKFIFNCIERNIEYSKLFWFLIIACTGHIFVHFTCGWYEAYRKVKTPEVYRYIFHRVMDLSDSLELKDYETPEFYDKYARALDRVVDSSIDLAIKFGVYFGNVVSTIASLVIIVMVDPVLLVFMIVPMFVSLYFGNKNGKCNYDRENAITVVTTRPYAMAAKLKRDHERLMAETQQEMAEIKRQMDAQREIANGGNAFWDLVTFGKSGKKSLEAAEKLNALTDQYAKLMKKTHDMKKEDPAADYLREANAAKQDKAEAEKAEKQKKAVADAMDGMKRLDEASAKYAEAEKRRSKALADEQVRQDKIVLDSRLSRLKRQADAERQRLGSFGFSLDVNPNESASSRRGRVRRMQLDASIAEKQEAQRSGERVRYTAQERRRIADYRDSSRKLAKTEEQIAQLEAAGKAAEAARQQQAAADRLSESATALNQAALELRAAGGSAPVATMAQPAATQPASAGKSLPPVHPSSRANVATGVSQVVSYGPMLGKIINLLQTRAFVIRNS